MAEGPFLSIITRTYKRPRMLAQCVASVQAQTVPVEHIVAEDMQGLGVAESHRLLLEAQPHGRYVMHLDDDNLIVYPWFVSDLEAAANAYDPDVIVFRMNNCEFGILPDRFVWQQKPLWRHIDGGCVAVKRDVWRACIPAIITGGPDGGPCYEGDFFYLKALWAYTNRIHWMNKIAVLTQRVSKGKGEGEA